MTAEQLARNPGYPANEINRFVRETIFFGTRGQNSFKGYGVLDLAATYSIPAWRPVAPWLKVEIYNAFNNQKQIAWDRTVRVDPSSPLDANGIRMGYIEGLRYGLKRFSNRPCTTWGGRGTSAHTDAGGPMRAYSMDLRERALLDSDAGMKAADVAAKYRVSGSWVQLLKQRRRDTGEVAPRVQRHGRRCMLEPHLHTLAALIAAHPDRTLAELKDALATPASVPTVWRAVRALGLTVKKNGPPVRTRSA